MYGDLKILTGSAHPELAKAICNHLGCQLTPTLTSTFSDGELRIEISDNVRGDDVFVIQPTCMPVNTNLIQLCLMLDALKRASAGRITAVVPYYGYARQDRKVSPRAPISAKMVAKRITRAIRGRNQPAPRAGSTASTRGGASSSKITDSATTGSGEGSMPLILVCRLLGRKSEKS